MGSATTVANRGIRQHSVGVVVRHHASTDASLTHRQLQDQISHKKRSKKSSINLCRVI